MARVKGLLQSMREETDVLKKDPSRAKPSEVRVRENLQNTLTRKFVDLAKDYQNRQVPQMLPCVAGGGGGVLIRCSPLSFDC